MAREAASSRPLTDHEEIRNWAEERRAKPACVRNTGGNGDIGMIRLDFPGYSGEQSLEEISWDDWFSKFDENNLALIVQEQTSQGQKSNFNKLVSRDTAEQKQRASASSKASQTEDTDLEDEDEDMQDEDEGMESTTALSTGKTRRQAGARGAAQKKDAKTSSGVDTADLGEENEEETSGTGKARTRGATGQANTRGRRTGRARKSSSRTSASRTQKNSGAGRRSRSKSTRGGNSRTKTRKAATPINKKRATARGRKPPSRQGGTRRRAA